MRWVRYFEGSRLNGSLGKPDDALRYAQAGLRIDRDCLGLDHVLYQDSLKVVRRLQGVV
jgi:hypothetical protein